MQGFTIFKRLSLSYLTLSLIVIFMGIYTTWRLDQLNRISSSLSAVDSEIISLVNHTKDKFLSQARFGRKYMVSQDQDFHDQFLQTKKIIYEQFDKIEQHLDNPTKENVFKPLQDNYQKYLTISRNEFSTVDKEASSIPWKLQEDKEQLFNKIISELDHINQLTKARMNTKIDTSNSIASQALKLNISAILIALVMTIIIAYFNARTINRPILSLMQGTRKIANKEFDKTLEISSPPEIKDLADSFNHMSSRLQELDQMKEGLIAHVSHELRSPLTSIKEASNLLLEGDLKESSKNQHNLLLIIQEECASLISKVNNILDLSHMESGMAEFQMQEIGIAPLAEKSIAKMKPIADKKGIILEMNLPEQLPKVYIDSEKIHQVIINLLDNALKFSSSQGKVTLSAQGKDEYNKKKGSQKMLEICVSDNGCGISEKDQTEIFDKFKKVHGKGTGLGLSIAKNIVTAHGGNIWVKSEPGQGSSFCFTLPVSS